jgi:hypothetical protein
VKKNVLARDLRVDEGHITSVKPNGDGTFDVGVRFERTRPGGGAEKHLFWATVDANARLLNVPQG